MLPPPVLAERINVTNVRGMQVEYVQPVREPIVKHLKTDFEMSTIYQITVSNQDKVKPSLRRACFSSKEAANDTLRENGFTYYKDSDLWHNGSTEAWVEEHVVNENKLLLGKEEVHLR